MAKKNSAPGKNSRDLDDEESDLSPNSTPALGLCCHKRLAKLCSCIFSSGFCPRSRGVWVVLAWSTLLHAFNFYALMSVFWWQFYRIMLKDTTKLPHPTTDDDLDKRPEFIVLGIAQSLALLLYPPAGLLAELVWARFKVLMLGTVMMFVGLLTLTPMLTLIFREYVCFFGEEQNNTACAENMLAESHQLKFYLVFLFISLFVFKLGKALYEANVIQFGVDQLQFSPSSDLSSFVHWYYWTTAFLAWLTSPSKPGYFGVQLLYVPILQMILILGTPLLLYFRSHVILEPVGGNNPLRLIYRVLNFARKHTRPLHRSAFTYGELLPSRLDLGKTRYGGPFTTEQVEDVKSFWRVLAVLLSLFGFTLLHNRHLAYLATFSWSSVVLSVFGPSGTGYSSFVIVVGIPLFQWIGWPYSTDMLKRIGVGLVIGLTSSASVILIKVYLPYDHVVNDHLLNHLLAVPLFLNGLAYLMVFPTALEFILAQAPRNMQGLLIGLWYAYQSQGVVTDLVSIGISSKWSFYWVDFALFIVSTAALVVYVLVAYSYQHRWRDEPSIVNRQAIIEEYMDRQLSYEQSCRENKVEFNSISRGYVNLNGNEVNYSTFPVPKGKLNMIPES